MLAPNTITDERLQRAARVIARAVIEFGEVYVPLLERIETEIAARARQITPAERARRLLADIQSH